VLPAARLGQWKVADKVDKLDTFVNYLGTERELSFPQMEPARRTLGEDDQWDPGRREYWEGIALARFVIRKCFRIIDEQARRHGLEPLEHQVLLQVHGSRREMLYVNHVAERLDIAPAFASKLIRGLEARGLVTRSQSAIDKRITEVRLTQTGRQLLHRINEMVTYELEHFRRQLDERDRVTALTIFGFYVGLAPGRGD
jgi:DNA-binding MarR family transcriptional regulator